MRRKKKWLAERGRISRIPIWPRARKPALSSRQSSKAENGWSHRRLKSIRVTRTFRRRPRCLGPLALDRLSPGCSVAGMPNRRRHRWRNSAELTGLAVGLRSGNASRYSAGREHTARPTRGATSPWAQSGECFQIRRPHPRRLSRGW